MICIKCGANVNSEDNFCEECGASLKQADSSGQGFPKTDFFICDSSLAGTTNKGRKHPFNEDYCSVGKCEGSDSFLIVADGVSSSVNAVNGSQKAVEVIRERLIKNDTGAKELITSAISLADVCVKNLPYETKEDGLYGPETTIVAALVKGEAVTIGWVGDSRAYVLNAERQVQKLLTVDDSWIELVVAQGSMTREEASLDRRAHYVTQVLGMHDEQAEIHLTDCKLMKGDMLLLCSDGLWNYFQGDNALLSAVMAFGINSDAASICQNLIELANAAGGHDNISVAILKTF